MTTNKRDTAPSAPVEPRVMRHFKVILAESHEPKGVATAAIRGCMCCLMSICGMGGGGDYICIDCLDKMREGEMSRAIYLLEKEKMTHNAFYTPD
jgi:hypothetical protein